MTKKNPQKDGYFSNSDENFAGGREFTEDPNDPDFDTFMYYGKEIWEAYYKY